MRRLWFLAVLVVPAITLISTACGNSSFSSSDDDAGSNGDGTTQDGSIADGAPSDGSIVDGASTRFCERFDGSVFCDDFDRKNEILGDTWSYDGSFASTDGGTLQLTDAEAQSAPSSMAASVAVDLTANDFTAALTYVLGSRSSTVAFDFLVPAGANCSGAGVSFAQVGIDEPITPVPSNFAYFGTTAAGVPHLGLAGTAFADFYGDASLPPSWVRVRLTTRVDSYTDGGDDIVAAAYLTPAGSDDTVDASVALSGSVSFRPTGTNTWVSIGVSSKSSLPCTAYIDNVAVYQ